MMSMRRTWDTGTRTDQHGRPRNVQNQREEEAMKAHAKTRRKWRWVAQGSMDAIGDRAGTSNRVAKAIQRAPSTVRYARTDPTRLDRRLREVMEMGMGMAAAGCDLTPLIANLRACHQRTKLVEAETADLVEWGCHLMRLENEEGYREDCCSLVGVGHAEALRLVAEVSWQLADVLDELAARDVDLHAEYRARQEVAA